MSQSSSHSCNWPALPICSGASLARVALHVCCRPASVPRVTGGVDRVGEQVAQDRLVHRRARRQRRAERVRVLGRQRRRGDQPVVRWLFDEGIEEELRRAFQQRVDAFQILAIAGVLVAIPERQRQPRAAGRPHAVLRSVDRSRGAPQIGVVMRHPAAGAVHLARRPRAGHRQVRHQCRQRIHRLGEVGRERRPVVHLGVDVDGVLAAPGRRHALVPQALQVRRLATRCGSWQSAGSGRTGSRARQARDRRRRQTHARARRSARRFEAPRSSVTRLNSCW